MGTYGAMQLTLIPLSPTSLAADFVMPITPCFAAVYAAFLGNPISPAILEAFITEPRLFIFRICALMQCITMILVSYKQSTVLAYCFLPPVKLTSITNSQSGSFKSSTLSILMLLGITPAIFTAPSSFPNFSTVLEIQSST